MMFSSIHNFYEQLVLERILTVTKERNESLDAELMEDIACIALNRLPSRYIRHNVDMAFSLSDTERENMDFQVARAVDEAIEFSGRRHAPH
ncbi:competence protein ComFB [Gammaproteobacteria bacterium]